MKVQYIYSYFMGTLGYNSGKSRTKSNSTQNKSRGNVLGNGGGGFSDQSNSSGTSTPSPSKELWPAKFPGGQPIPANPDLAFPQASRPIPAPAGFLPKAATSNSSNSGPAINTEIESNKTRQYIDPSRSWTNAYRLINASTWSAAIIINQEIFGNSFDGVIQARQVSKENWDEPTGSMVTGTSDADIIRGLGGWDIIDAGFGNDLVHGGNGRDIITGGLGSDELHGDFGWNTYSSEKDGYVDLIAIKSDHFLYNHWYASAGNNRNGEKADIIEGLDSFDQIKIIGVETSDLTFKAGVSHKGVSGIGIYTKGILEALYTGGGLTVSQITSMTTGDSSATAMSNQVWSYWGDNTVPELQA